MSFLNLDCQLNRKKENSQRPLFEGEEMEGFSSYNASNLLYKRPAFEGSVVNLYGSNQYSQQIYDENEEPDSLYTAFDLLGMQSTQHYEEQQFTDVMSQQHLMISKNQTLEQIQDLQSEKIFEQSDLHFQNIQTVSDLQQQLAKNQLYLAQTYSAAANSQQIQSQALSELTSLAANERLDAQPGDDAIYQLEAKILFNIQQRDQMYYSVNPYYLQNKQKHLQWHMRVLLIDWMMEVCDEFALMRETYHLAVTFTDLFLSRQICPIEKLQLLGASSLMLACKIEEIVCPRVRDFAFATDHGFNHQQLVEMEVDISRAMEFQLYPVTLNYWANYVMAKWDIYARTNPFNFALLSGIVDEDSPRPMKGQIPFFKTDNIEDYRRFRSILQVLDLSLLDLESYKYNKLEIVASATYFQIGLFYQVFTRRDISMMPNIETLLINIEQQGLEFSLMMQNFLGMNFNLNIQEIVGTLQYVSRLFGLEPCLDFPIIIQKQKREIKNQEEFFSFQSHVKGGMEYVKYIKQQFRNSQSQNQHSQQ
ncbi:UNKNOWN [Stylonychia lemnae]|uniref:Cyclin-like domain-containing protein n=1 Tax=Stylonychia lemnae TaxID=5949 RepID=A0A078AVN5_STYLE|nr:UNKNOWN [Stylonychia lemnae]|eukprot:CDW86136.1 UNKNOWN [Stylonychia lemnae]